ncbi:MAG: carbonic anhydrase [Planctomycetota bacterium]|nr:carbonic anhydrase [Planctomycetota bacterium]
MLKKTLGCLTLTFLLGFGAVFAAEAAHAKAAPAAEKGVITPKAAQQLLKDGNQRYLEVALRLQMAGDEKAKLRKDLAKNGQHPIATIIACGDSRVPPEYIFDQPIGGLFIIRGAGNTAGVEAVGSVQYAVDHLNVPLVVVMGHSKCGAIGAVVEGGHAEGTLVELLKPITASFKTVEAEIAKGGDAMRLTTVANVKRSIEVLKTYEPELQKRLAAGKLLLVGAVYDIETGVVEWLD